jgi:hypothetical protein
MPDYESCDGNGGDIGAFELGKLKVAQLER